MTSRFAVRDRIAALDPAVDYETIYRLTALTEFPWDVTRALELALYRTFAVPSIARVLDDSGEFRLRAQKRYDDTVLLLGTVLENGLESPLGKQALSRINRVHSPWPISNDDYLYTLGTFVFVPQRWLDRWGWRPLLPQEREAMFRYYRRLGELMGIRELPSDAGAFEAYFDAYERDRFALGAAQVRTATATRELFVGWFPQPLRPALRQGVTALMDEPLRASFGYPAPPRWLPSLVSGVLGARARALRWAPPRRTPAVGTASRLIRSYPGGWSIRELGPPDRLPGPSAQPRSGRAPGA